MIDLFKSVVRWVTGDPQALQNVRLRMMSPNEYETFRQNHLERPFERRVAEDLDAAAVWREQKKAQAVSGIGHDTRDFGCNKDVATNPQERRQPIGHADASVANKDNASVLDSATRLQRDRIRMPPPPTPSKFTFSNMPRSLNQDSGSHSTFNESVIARTMPSASSRASLVGLQDTEQEERAKRYADALEIPADSGLWYQSESGLYFHLGLRGMEPLLPTAWMVDFKTFPLILFEDDLEADCLIRNIYGPQFRAIRALRELVETANRVRDLIQAKHKMIKIQRSLQKSLEDYLNWALSDGDLYLTSNSLPTYVILQRKSQQPIVEAIAHLATAMEDLLRKHAWFFYDESIQNSSHYFTGSEQRPQNSCDSTHKPSEHEVENRPEPQIHDDSSGHDPPVIIGFLIVHTTVSIFSLNIRNAKVAALTNDEGRDIHMLGRFNFVERGADVWNALALAICCCHLRNALLAGAIPRDNIKGLQNFQAAMTPRPGEAMPRLDHGRVAGFVGKKEFEAATKRKREIDDGGAEVGGVVGEYRKLVEVDVKDKGKANEIVGTISEKNEGKRIAAPIEPKSHDRKRLKLALSIPDASDPDL